VAGTVAPDVEATGNLLGMKDVSHLLIHAAADVIHPCGEDTTVAAVEIEIMSVAHVRHVVSRQIEVAILVVVAGEEAGGVERAAHGEDAGEGLRVAEGDVDRMVTTEAAPNGTEARRAVPVADEGNDLFQDVLLEAKMAGDPGAWNDGAVVPAFGVNGINTKELQMASFDLVLNGADHAPVLEVEETPAGGRKGKCGRAGVSEDEELHLPPEGWRQPFVIFAVHWLYCSEIGG